MKHVLLNGITHVGLRGDVVDFEKVEPVVPESRVQYFLQSGHIREATVVEAEQAHVTLGDAIERKESFETLLMRRDAEIVDLKQKVQDLDSELASIRAVKVTQDSGPKIEKLAALIKEKDATIRDLEHKLGSKK